VDLRPGEFGGGGLEDIGGGANLRAQATERFQRIRGQGGQIAVGGAEDERAFPEGIGAEANPFLGKVGAFPGEAFVEAIEDEEGAVVGPGIGFSGRCTSLKYSAVPRRLASELKRRRARVLLRAPRAQADSAASLASAYSFQRCAQSASSWNWRASAMASHGLSEGLVWR
jgi:hypothetical protein